MEYEMQPYIVYVRTDDTERITGVNSSAFLRDITGWIEIDQGFGDKHHHAQGNYFDKPLCDERGICRYKAYQFVDAPAGKIIARFFKNGEEYVILERTQEEMDADYVVPEPKPSTDERVAQLETQNETLLECLLEMSEIVYA